MSVDGETAYFWGGPLHGQARLVDPLRGYVLIPALAQPSIAEQALRDDAPLGNVKLRQLVYHQRKIRFGQDRTLLFYVCPEPPEKCDSQIEALLWAIMRPTSPAHKEVI